MSLRSSLSLHYVLIRLYLELNHVTNTSIPLFTRLLTFLESPYHSSSVQNFIPRVKLADLACRAVSHPPKRRPDLIRPASSKVADKTQPIP